MKRNVLLALLGSLVLSMFASTASAAATTAYTFKGKVKVNLGTGFFTGVLVGGKPFVVDLPATMKITADGKTLATKEFTLSASVTDILLASLRGFSFTRPTPSVKASVPNKATRVEVSVTICRTRTPAGMCLPPVTRKVTIPWLNRTLPFLFGTVDFGTLTVDY